MHTRSQFGVVEPNFSKYICLFIHSFNKHALSTCYGSILGTVLSHCSYSRERHQPVFLLLGDYGLV
jgi:hypothetical protein